MATGRTRGPLVVTDALTVDGASTLTGNVTCAGTVVTTNATGKLAKLFIPWQAFITSQTSGAATTFVSDGTGSPVSAGNIATSGLGGIFLDAATDTVSTLIPVPYDMDVTAAATFEVPMHFAAATASGDSITLNLLYQELTANTTALVTAATAASPDFSARAWAVDDAIHIATGATIAANTLTNGRWLNLKVSVGTFTNFSASEVAFLGLEMTYTKRFL